MANNKFGRSFPAVVKDKDEEYPHNIDDLLIKIGKLEKAAESDAEEIDRLIMKLKKILEIDND